MADYFLSNASGAGGAGNGSSWANAYLTLTALLTRTGPAFLAGDRIWVGDDHAETLASATTFTFTGTALLPNFIYVVDHTVASPGLADLRIGTVSGGSIIGTGTAQIIYNGFYYCYGLYIGAGSGAGGANLAFQNTGFATYDNCKIVNASTTGGNILLTGGSAPNLFQDCVFKGHHNGISLNGRGGPHLVRCSWDTSVVSPAQIFVGNAQNTRALVEDCDFSNCTGASSIFSGAGGNWVSAIFKRCKIPNITALGGVQAGGHELCDLEFIQCDSGGAVYRNEKWTGTGTQTTNLAAARVGGATEGGVALSHKVVTSASPKYPYCIRLNPYVIWNAVTGSALNITVEGIADPRDFTALPKDDEVAVEAEYLGYASSTLGAKIDGQKVSPLSTAAALTASSADWTAGATVRNNSQGYTLGTMFKIASKPGMLFIVTTAGTTAASEPAGYGTAVDGTTGIVDNTVRAAAFWRFKQTLTTTGSGTTPHPQMAGYVYVTPKVFKPSVVNGVFFDPLPILS